MRPCEHSFISGMPTEALEQLFLVVGIRMREIVLQDCLLWCKQGEKWQENGGLVRVKSEFTACKLRLYLA